MVIVRMVMNVYTSMSRKTRNYLYAKITIMVSVRKALDAIKDMYGESFANFIWLDSVQMDLNVSMAFISRLLQKSVNLKRRSRNERDKVIMIAKMTITAKILVGKAVEEEEVAAGGGTRETEDE